MSDIVPPLPFEYRTRQRSIPWEDFTRARMVLEQRDRELEDFLGRHLPAAEGGAHKYAHMTMRWTQNYSGSYSWTASLNTSGASGVLIPTQNDDIEPGGIEINEHGLYLLTYNWIATTRVAAATVSRFKLWFQVDPYGPVDDPTNITFDSKAIVSAADTDDIQGAVANTMSLWPGDIVLPPTSGFLGAWRHQSLDIHASVVWLSDTTEYEPCS